MGEIRIIDMVDHVLHCGVGNNYVVLKKVLS